MVVGWTLFFVYGVYGPIAVTALAQARPAVTKDTVDQWMTKLSNWGRWGQDDQRGTLNLITPEKRKRAAALVQAGVSVSLSKQRAKRFFDLVGVGKDVWLDIRSSPGPHLNCRCSYATGIDSLDLQPSPMCQLK